MRRPYQVRSIDRCKTNVVLLNDAWIQAVEVHDQYEFVVQALFWLKDQASFIFVLFLHVAGVLSIGMFLFDFDFVFAEDLVWANVFIPVKFMEQNVFVSFGTRPAEGSRPRVPGKVSQDLRQRQHLDPQGDGSNEICISLAMVDIV
jgi:hypothetical protein